MRTISFIIIFSFALAGPSFSTTNDSGLPGVGAFTYNGLQPLPDAASNKVAHLTLTRRG